MSSDHPIFEPLFVDQKRLRSYYEAAAEGGRDSRWQWEAGVSLTGPSLLVGRDREAGATVAQKYRAVVEYLNAQGVLRQERPRQVDSWDYGHPLPDLPEDVQADLAGLFRLETCLIRSVLIPPTSGLTPSLERGLALWIADEAEAHGRDGRRLVLIEEFPLKDEPYADRWTGASLLEALRYASGGNVGSDLGVKSERLGVDPVKALESLGAVIGLEKMVEVLYRVRLTFAERHRDFARTTIGYPIVIRRA